MNLEEKTHLSEKEVRRAEVAGADRIGPTVPEVVRSLRDQFVEEDPAIDCYEDINWGRCVQMANGTLRILQNENWRLYSSWFNRGDAGMDRDTGYEELSIGHNWITDGKRHYGAQRPDGVLDPSDLPNFANPRDPEDIPCHPS